MTATQSTIQREVGGAEHGATSRVTRVRVPHA
jgi:hypothetical protein